MYSLINWVDVRDRLPENDGLYFTMAMHEDGSADYAAFKYNVNLGEFYTLDGLPCIRISDVTHWAPYILPLKEGHTLLLEHWKRTQTATLKGYLRRLSGYVKEDKRLGDMVATAVQGKIQTMIRRLCEAEGRWNNDCGNRRRTD